MRPMVQIIITSSLFHNRLQTMSLTFTPTHYQKPFILDPLHTKDMKDTYPLQGETQPASHPLKRSIFRVESQQMTWSYT